MKKTIYTSLVLLLCMSSSYTVAPAFAVGGASVMAKVEGQLIPAINAKKQAWSNQLATMAESDAKLIDAFVAIEDYMVKQEEMVNNALLKNPDTNEDGSLSRKAFETTNMNVADKQEKYMTGFTDEATTFYMASGENGAESANKMINKTIDEVLAGNILVEDGIQSPSVNVASLFLPKTYRNDDGVENPDDIASQLKNAIFFIQNAVEPYTATRIKDEAIFSNYVTTHVTKAGELSRLSRNSLAFSNLTDSAVRRTNIDEGGLGTFIKSYMKSLDDQGETSLFADLVKDLPDDISKHEFMDYLVYQISMNPAWHVALGKAKPKALARRKAEMTAFLSILNWETSKMLERLVATSAAQLSINTDKN